MNVLLVSAPMAETWQVTTDHINGQYPVGLGYLHAYLEQSGHQVRTLYLVNNSHEEGMAAFYQAIHKDPPQIIGFNIITDNRVSSFLMMQELPALHPNAQVIIGGIHVSAMHEQILTAFPNVIAVLGEGETTAAELLQTLESGGYLFDVQGIAYFNSEQQQVVTTEQRPLLEDLDTLPFPKHEIFWHPDRVEADLLTSRGCPFECSFCALDALSRRKVRFRSVENVVDEIEYLQKSFPKLEQVHIYDDQFFISNKRAIEICEEIIKRGIKLKFFCQGRLRPISLELVDALYRANFRLVTLGLETGSRRMLEKCRKKITPEDALHAITMFKNYPSINLHVLLMVGLPGESLATIMETAELVNRMQEIRFHDYSQIIQTTFIYPGTEIYRNAKQSGFINDDYWLTSQNAPLYLVEHNKEMMTIYREILLTHISLARIFTPSGLAAQKSRLTEIIRFCLSYPDHYQPVAELVSRVVNTMIHKKELKFDISTKHPLPSGALPTLRLLPNQNGTPATEFSLHIGKIESSNATAMHIVRDYYLFRAEKPTELINAAIIAYLEEMFGSGRTKELHTSLGMHTWAQGNSHHRFNIVL
ncbi:MAG: B12-binding domain-containing radical SAM protein [Magnetococcales bacterium]|nr:B12-binding domain-containing radical SAM protein [Magnetococcales bacterium]